MNKMHRSRSRSQDFKNHFLQTQTPNQMLASNGLSDDYASGNTYITHGQRHTTNRHNHNGYYQNLTNPDDGEYAGRNDYKPDRKECFSKKSQRRHEENLYSDDDISLTCSSRSVSSKPTTVIELSNKTAKRLLNITRSKASLLKTVEEGIGQKEPTNHACPCRRPSKETLKYETDESIACTSSSLAEVINEKIIHPLVKEFRLSYLHNIKGEVTIMENLEKLPLKLNKICRKLERD